MSNSVTPVVLSEDKLRHEPMREGDVFDVNTIPLSPAKENLIERAQDGLSLTGEMLVSGQTNNPIDTSVDGKLYVNVKQMIDPADKVLGTCDNVLFTNLSLVFNSEDSKLSLVGNDGQVISEQALMVKLDTSTAGDGLAVGRDGKVYVDLQGLIDPDGGLIVGRDGQLGVDLRKLVDTDTGLVVSPEGRLGIDLNKLASLLDGKISHPVSADDDNILTLGSDGKPYLPGDRGSL